MLMFLQPGIRTLGLTRAEDTVHVLVWCAAVAMALLLGSAIGHMQAPPWHGAAPGPAGQARTSGATRTPPAWSPERESTYPFQTWAQDLLAWSIVVTDMDAAQQTAAIILQLGGAARELARGMSYQDITQGGMINGQPVDPVTFLLTHLAQQFAPLGEEARLRAISELMQFHRNPGEQIDSMLSRFMTLRFRAGQGGQGMAMSWEGYSWLLLKACGVSHHQLLNVLQPYQGRFPGTEAEFNAMQLTLRRMGHILEQAPGNVASHLRSASSRAYMVDTAGDAGANPWQEPDPWLDQDPWQPVYSPSARSPGAAASSQEQHDAYYVPSADGQSDTDTETESSSGAPLDYRGDPELQNLSPQQIDEHLFWTYQQAKSRWRKHMQKPVRRVRKFLRRSGKGKARGKGKGKGSSRFDFLANMDDSAVDAVFFGGKGKPKGKRRSTGKGKGRRRNPIGSDGQVMRCGICNSDTHFRAQCPRNTGHSVGGVGTTFTSYAEAGPLGDLLYMVYPGTAGTSTLPPDDEPRSSTSRRPTRNADVLPPVPNDSDAWWQDAPISTGHSPFVPHMRAPFETSGYGTSGRDFLPPSGTVIGASIPAEAVAPAPWEQTIDTVHQTWLGSFSRPVAQLHHPDQVAPQMTTPVLTSFRHLQSRRQDRLRAQASGTDGNQSARPWEGLTYPEGFAAPPGLGRSADDGAMRQAIPDDLQRFADQMATHQEVNRSRLADERERRRRAAARMLATSEPSDRDARAGERATEEHDEEPLCVICQEPFDGEDRVAMLQCRHMFHLTCVDEWVAAQTQEGQEVQCPICRRHLLVSAHFTRTPADEPEDSAAQQGDAGPQSVQDFVMHTPLAASDHSHDSFATGATGSSLVRPTFPWWPAAGCEAEECHPYYHAATQLPSGKLSVIVDPGAWTNLMGAKVARALAQRALGQGHQPEQTRMPKALDIQGVGNGSQQCQWQLTCPIAVKDETGQSKLHKITAPIVQGTGENLPGLLGLRSLEQERAILDCGSRMLHLVGQGEVQLTLPPGSVSIPLQKAPSGHLVMVIDEYEEVAASRGGLPEASLQLHTVAAASSSRGQAPPSSSRPATSVDSRAVSFNI